MSETGPKTTPGRRIVDTHVHVWPLDDAPGRQPVPGAKVRPPKAAAPVEWLLEDMEEFGIRHCVLVQSSAWHHQLQKGRAALRSDT